MYRFCSKSLAAPCFLLVLLLATGGCGEHKKAARPANEIANVAGASISQDAFQALLDTRARGSASNHFDTLAAKEVLLDELIRREAILAKAKAAGFDQRPDIQESVKRLIVSKFQEENLRLTNDAKLAGSEEEIQQYYHQHADKFTDPAKVRGAIIFIRASKFAPAEKRQELMDKAQKLLTQAQSATAEQFSRLVQENSEDQSTRYRGGDLGWINRDTSFTGADPSVIEALFALQKPGDFAPVITTRKGFCLVKLIDSKAAGMKPLAQVKDAVAYFVRREKQEKREQDFYTAMKTGIGIHIDEPKLEAMRPSPPPLLLPPATPGAMAQK